MTHTVHDDFLGKPVEVFFRCERSKDVQKYTNIEWFQAEELSMQYEP